MATKQVIVIRKDLKMRRGKEIAQGAHASIKFLVDRIKEHVSTGGSSDTWDERPIDFMRFSDAEKEWMEGLFKKVCLQVNSEDELIGIYMAAKKAGLETHLITDSGLTEFNGVPTKTCLAIGPDEESKIDEITGKLSLY